MPDKFPDFAALAAGCEAGTDYAIRAEIRPSTVLVMAPHGGNIEPGTSELARAVAAADLNLYCFEGLRAGAFALLHLTSTRFDEPMALGMVRTAERVLTVHGLAPNDRRILVGGRDDRFASCVADELAARGFPAERVTMGPYAAMQRENICNRGRGGGGVQLEIGRGLRDELRHQPDVKAKLAAALRQAIGIILQ